MKLRGKESHTLNKSSLVSKATCDSYLWIDTKIIEAKIANHTGIDWSLTAYRAITVVMPLLLRRDELARQNPTDAIIHDMAICEEKYEYGFAGFARILNLVVPLGKGSLCDKCSH